MDTKENLGVGLDFSEKKGQQHRQEYIKLKLAALLGWDCLSIFSEKEEIAKPLVEHYRERERILSSGLAPVDRRIQRFLTQFLKDEGEEVAQLPGSTLVLDQYGLARELSLPHKKDRYHSRWVDSYRVKQGILHNPVHDRRTTKGTFHISAGGPSVPPEKKEVPKKTWGRLWKAALSPPPELSVLPYLSEEKAYPEEAFSFASLFLTPVVVPAVPDFISEKRIEIRFFVPGGLVSNLDFLESIFGNGGDPYLLSNNLALDPYHWTGHTGCVVLAPHLVKLTKKELGLPHFEEASQRQRQEGMCWKNPTEIYNEGLPFKATARGKEGVIVTLIADNYYGYSKKEVKTQISYSANLYGLVEEEHAGGAIAFPSYNLGRKFLPDSSFASGDYSFKEVETLLGDRLVSYPEGYAQDKKYPSIFYLPENSTITLEDQMAHWKHEGKKQTLKILTGRHYLHPSGYKIHMERHPTGTGWYLVGTCAEGLFCHKPCTVSGGGKSEISKSIADAVRYGPIYVGNLNEDFDEVQKIIDHDFISRYKPEFRKLLKDDHRSRPILSPKRSLGSVIKLLSPSSHCTDEFNEWVSQIPNRIKGLIFLVKRLHDPKSEQDWRSKFSVNIINHASGHELRYRREELRAGYLRTGLTPEGSWIMNKLRQDYLPAAKIVMEDDVAATITVPRKKLKSLKLKKEGKRSQKVIKNCEYRFFQRPDEAIHRGIDKAAEYDMSQSSNFLSNFEALKGENAQELIEKTQEFYKYTEPMRQMIEEIYEKKESCYFVSSSHPRIVDGKPSKNPRYLQLSRDLANAENRYLAEIGIRLARKLPLDRPLQFLVGAVLPGRRTTPFDRLQGVRPLAVYGPIHYQELPELFMDFLCSLTGKSPSTTGVGSEGALTKGPFNALPPIVDLNNALLSYILTGYHGYTTPSSFIGPKCRVDHDISLLIPELWCRLTESERDPKQLIEKGLLEKVEDFTYKGELLLASRLGYRINEEFLNAYMGRLFENPEIIFPSEMLRPETQDPDEFAEGIKNIMEAQKKLAQIYLEKDQAKDAIPPLKALIHIMAEGNYEGLSLTSPAFRALFEEKYVRESDWYQKRLFHFQSKQSRLLERQLKELEEAIEEKGQRREVQKELAHRKTLVVALQKEVQSSQFLNDLQGTIGADLSL